MVEGGEHGVHKLPASLYTTSQSPRSQKGPPRYFLDLARITPRKMTILNYANACSDAYV